VKISTKGLSTLIFLASCAIGPGTTVYAQGPAYPAKNPARGDPTASGPASGSIADPGMNTSVNSGITNPKSGANNDPALQEPKSGPTGAPGVGTESGSVDANGLHSRTQAPIPTP
jgi:hypothetical protein